MKLGYYPEPMPPDNGLGTVASYFFYPPAGSDWSYVLAAWDGVPDSIFQTGPFTTMPQTGIDITGFTASCFASQTTPGSYDSRINAGEWIGPSYTGPFIIGAVDDPQTTQSFQPYMDGSGRLVLDDRSKPDGFYELCEGIMLVVGGAIAAGAIASSSAVVATDAATAAATDAAATDAAAAAEQAASDAAAQAASDAAEQAASDAAAQAASDAAAQAAQQAATDAAAQTSSLITPATPGYADLTGSASALNPLTGVAPDLTTVAPDLTTVAPDLTSASALTPGTGVTDAFMNSLTQPGVDTPESLLNANTSQIITSSTSGVPVSNLTSPTPSGLMASPSGEDQQLLTAAANGTVIDPSTGLPITDSSTGLPNISPQQAASAASAAAKLIGGAVAGGAAAAGSSILNSGATTGQMGETSPGAMSIVVLAGLVALLLSGKRK